MSSSPTGTAIIRSVESLRRIIKAPPATVTAKIMEGPLRNSPSEFLAAVRLGIITVFGGDDAPQAFVVGGPAGFVTQDAAGRLIVPLPQAERGAITAPDRFAGMLLMVPGVRYTLRVNGSVTLSDDDASLVLTPAQSYAHCAKAFIRSELWSAGSAESGTSPGDSGTESALDGQAIEFIGRAPFAAISTSLEGSDADVSPRGDPPGFVQVVDSNHLFIPERPGNRIADTLQNIIANPAASVLFVVPGDSRVLEVNGEAEVTTDTGLCAGAEVNGKVPKLGIFITVRSVRLRDCAALKTSGAWDPSSHASEDGLPTIGALVVDPNSVRSLAKRALTGVTDRAVELDYKRNLY